MFSFYLVYHFPTFFLYDDVPFDVFLVLVSFVCCLNCFLFSSGATKSIYALEPLDVGRTLQVEVVSNGQKVNMMTTGPIESGWFFALRFFSHPLPTLAYSISPSPAPCYPVKENWLNHLWQLQGLELMLRCFCENLTPNSMYAIHLFIIHKVDIFSCCCTFMFVPTSSWPIKYTKLSSTIETNRCRKWNYDMFPHFSQNYNPNRLAGQSC